MENNIPEIKIDPFTKKRVIEWKRLGENYFFEKPLNGSINMVSSKPNINRLFMSINHIDNKDFLILRHPNKDFMLNPNDKFYFLFENNEVLELNIENPSFFIYESFNDTYKKVFENRIFLFKEDLELLSKNIIKDWRILIGNKRIIEGMRHYGTNHNYQSKELLQKELKKMFSDYFKIISNLDDYIPPSKQQIEKINKNTNEECYLYLMKDLANEYYKIGVSNNPTYREKTLQSEKPSIELLLHKKFKNRKTAFAFESVLHKLYKDKRLRGEWFELNNSDIIEIKEILK